MLNRIIKEAKKFGVGEVIEHTLVKFFQSEGMKTKMYKVRDEYYSSLSQKEFEKEIEEIYFSVMNQNMDFNNVSLFTEKVQWLKIHGPITEMAKNTCQNFWVCGTDLKKLILMNCQNLFA